MDKLFFDYMTATIHKLPSVQNDVCLFSNGDRLTGSAVFYFFKAVERFKDIEVTTSLYNAKLNNVPLWLSPRGCRKGHAPIRDLNNNCVECEELKKNKKQDGRSTQVTRMINDYPDMILDYETAKTLGFKVYRTGDPCWQGHKGYRYVKNKTCVTCSRSYK